MSVDVSLGGMALAVSDDHKALSIFNVIGQWYLVLLHEAIGVESRANFKFHAGDYSRCPVAQPGTSFVCPVVGGHADKQLLGSLLRYPFYVFSVLSNT